MYFEHIVQAHYSTCFLYGNLNYKPYHIPLNISVQLRR